METEPDFLAEIKNLPDIILSDYSMPKIQRNALGGHPSTGQWLEYPFHSHFRDRGRSTSPSNAIQHGATDYLLKDRLERLGIAVERALEQKRLREGRDLACEALLKAGALQSAIFNSANFSSIATDAKGVIQIFNVGAERMLGYRAAVVVNKITPAEISDPQEVIARAEALSLELETPIARRALKGRLVLQSFARDRGHLRVDLHPQGWQPLSGGGVGHGAARRPRRDHRLSADRHR